MINFIDILKYIYISIIYLNKGLIEIILCDLHEQPNSTSLVSDGVECVLINKSFFVRHISKDFEIHLRKRVIYIILFFLF